jgi:hypothetical protein
MEKEWTKNDLECCEAHAKSRREMEASIFAEQGKAKRGRKITKMRGGAKKVPEDFYGMIAREIWGENDCDVERLFTTNEMGELQEGIAALAFASARAMCVIGVLLVKIDRMDMGLDAGYESNDEFIKTALADLPISPQNLYNLKNAMGVYIEHYDSLRRKKFDVVNHRTRLLYLPGAIAEHGKVKAVNALIEKKSKKDKKDFAKNVQADDAESDLDENEAKLLKRYICHANNRLGPLTKSASPEMRSFLKRKLVEAIAEWENLMS